MEPRRRARRNLMPGMDGTWPSPSSLPMHLRRATLIIGVDGDENRLAMARKMGADVTLNHHECNVVEEVLKLTGGGVDVASAAQRQTRRRRRLACISHSLKQHQPTARRVIPGFSPQQHRDGLKPGITLRAHAASPAVGNAGSSWSHQAVAWTDLPLTLITSIPPVPR